MVSWFLRIWGCQPHSNFSLPQITPIPKRPNTSHVLRQFCIICSRNFALRYRCMCSWFATGGSWQATVRSLMMWPESWRPKCDKIAKMFNKGPCWRLLFFGEFHYQRSLPIPLGFGLPANEATVSFQATIHVTPQQLSFYWSAIASSRLATQNQIIGTYYFIN